MGADGSYVNATSDATIVGYTNRGIIVAIAHAAPSSICFGTLVVKYMRPVP